MRVTRTKIGGGVVGHVQRLIDGVPIVEVGFFPDDRYSDKNNTPVAAVANWNNKGGGNLPSRPFFDKFLLLCRTAYNSALNRLAKRIISGEINRSRASDEIGSAAANDLRKIIDDWTDPANAPSVIARKGKNDPLVDTRQMINSVDFKEIHK